jgi:hypothetical protein
MVSDCGAAETVVKSSIDPFLLSEKA